MKIFQCAAEAKAICAEVHWHPSCFVGNSMTVHHATALVLVMCTASFGTAMLSRTLNTRAPARSAGLPAIGQTTAVIRAIDQRRQILLVLDASGVKAIRIDQATTIFVEGRIGGIRDLTPGQTIRATFQPGPSPALALWIEVA